MSLTATIEALVIAGATPEMLLAVVRTHEAARVDALTKRRASDAARQAVQRDKKSRDVTLLVDGHADASPHVGERTQVVTPSLPSLRSEELKNPPEKPSVSTPKGQTRGSRLPDNWRPMPFVVDCGGQALNGDDWGVELDKFRDYWRAVPGAKGLKLDWDATWRNWLRRASENSTRKAPHERPHHDAKFEARQANLAAAFRGADSAARRHRES